MLTTAGRGDGEGKQGEDVVQNGGCGGSGKNGGKPRHPLVFDAHQLYYNTIIAKGARTLHKDNLPQLSTLAKTNRIPLIQCRCRTCEGHRQGEAHCDRQY